MGAHAGAGVPGGDYAFCPRRLDDGPDVVTAPYNHANLDSDDPDYPTSRVRD